MWAQIDALTLHRICDRIFDSQGSILEVPFESYQRM
jgi:hypothetical protein